MRTDHRLCPQGSHTATFTDATVTMHCEVADTHDTFRRCAHVFASTGKRCTRAIRSDQWVYCRPHDPR